MNLEHSLQKSIVYRLMNPEIPCTKLHVFFSHLLSHWFNLLHLSIHPHPTLHHYQASHLHCPTISFVNCPLPPTSQHPITSTLPFTSPYHFNCLINCSPWSNPPSETSLSIYTHFNYTLPLNHHSPRINISFPPIPLVASVFIVRTTYSPPHHNYLPLWSTLQETFPSQPALILNYLLLPNTHLSLTSIIPLTKQYVYVPTLSSFHHELLSVLQQTSPSHPLRIFNHPLPPTTHLLRPWI